ncbi:hypothetical protein G7054_g4345 [Neopestalotiopsis clavispora]|nr:hypothetical protein G7054_g4345 [Neopestalotiopsis clavispora]
MSEHYSSRNAEARAGKAKKTYAMLDKYLESEATIMERIARAEPNLSKKQAKKKAIQDKKVYLEDWNTSWKKASR